MRGTPEDNQESVLIMLMIGICHFIKKHFVPLDRKDASAQHICTCMYVAHVGTRVVITASGN